jgi:hypothetical protein
MVTRRVVLEENFNFGMDDVALAQSNLSGSTDTKVKTTSRNEQNDPPL